MSRSVSSDDPFVEERSPDQVDDEFSTSSIKGITKSSSWQKEASPEDSSTSSNRITGITRRPSQQKEAPEETKSTSYHRNQLFVKMVKKYLIKKNIYIYIYSL